MSHANHFNQNYRCRLTNITDLQRVFCRKQGKIRRRLIHLDFSSMVANHSLTLNHMVMDVKRTVEQFSKEVQNLMMMKTNY